MSNVPWICPSDVRWAVNVSLVRSDCPPLLVLIYLRDHRVQMIKLMDPANVQVKFRDSAGEVAGVRVGGGAVTGFAGWLPVAVFPLASGSGALFGLVLVGHYEPVCGV